MEHLSLFSPFSITVPITTSVARPSSYPTRPHRRVRAPHFPSMPMHQHPASISKASDTQLSTGLRVGLVPAFPLTHEATDPC
ncbi:hypothetical protein CHLRE_13g562326v5 [Chlamydomonas reinhardtii]|uniref:Uncharacterized protein n=1 Tax=Chlamydomonas reinhardtii TaxID=3055 RepID=A0A2K3CZ08_CHLRE|nr:uncharacterized protein CHLRE_13g562326v5 [Chlamydomonas reinhardtii]PNW73520.1 hypothetical protein CHLRE_13g562326v5 [Chlamydomonas reinhardtii]